MLRTNVNKMLNTECCHKATVMLRLIDWARFNVPPNTL